MGYSISRCQVRHQNANTASNVMGASIGKACSCPSFLHTRFVRICGMCGFRGLNPSLQHSGILPSKLKVAGSNPIGLVSSGPKKGRLSMTCFTQSIHAESRIDGLTATNFFLSFLHIICTAPRPVMTAVGKPPPALVQCPAM
jgi:hypothetical protein